MYSHDAGALKGWYKIYLVVGAVLNSMVTLIMWLVLLGYTVSQGEPYVLIRISRAHKCDLDVYMYT